MDNRVTCRSIACTASPIRTSFWIWKSNAAARAVPRLSTLSTPGRSLGVVLLGLGKNRTFGHIYRLRLRADFCITMLVPDKGQKDPCSYGIITSSFRSSLNIHVALVEEVTKIWVRSHSRFGGRASGDAFAGQVKLEPFTMKSLMTYRGPDACISSCHNHLVQRASQRTQFDASGKQCIPSAPGIKSSIALELSSNIRWDSSVMGNFGSCRNRAFIQDAWQVFSVKYVRTWTSPLSCLRTQTLSGSDICFSKFGHVELAFTDRDMVGGLCTFCDTRHDANAATKQKYMNRKTESLR
jgi:hypothetical protein